MRAFFFVCRWCEPCRILAPILEEVVESNAVDLARVNVDDLSELALKHEVTSIPAVIAFANGTKKASFVGVRDRQFVTDFVKKLVGS